MRRCENRNVSALSFVELVIMLSVLGILAGIGVATLGRGPLTASHTVRLNQELNVLNSAVSAYLAFGGNLNDATSPEQVIEKLKTTVSEEQQRRLPGLSGSFLAREVGFVMQSAEEAGAGQPRIRWNPVGQRFELAESGEAGIKEMVMNTDGISDFPTETEERKTGLKYSSDGTWVWDYVEAAPTFPVGSSNFATADPSDSLPVPTGGAPPPLTPKLTLQRPVFSVPEGTYPAMDYPLHLHLTDPNPVGAGRIFYSVNYGAWSEFAVGSQVFVSPDTAVKAQVVPVDPAIWNASPTVDQLYKSFQSQLRAPLIGFSADFFVTGKTSSVNTITVTLSDVNEPGTSAIYYQLVPVPGSTGSATPFGLYAGPFDVTAAAYPDGFGVRAYASAKIPGYYDSRVNSRFATSQKGLFGGHLDLDTSTQVATVGSGNTDAHTHAITDKYGISEIDFFAIPDSNQIEITEAILNPQQKFKLTVVNADLSPGMSLVIDYEESGVSKTLDASVVDYDDTEVKDLTTFSLGGAPSSAILKSVRIVMSQDVLYGAGVIPTVTGDVVSNVLGKGGEWRNGSLTLQAVAVGSDGTEEFFIDSSLSSGNHGAAKIGLLWEAALFWHWGGESYDDPRNKYVPGQYNTVRLHIDGK